MNRRLLAALVLAASALNAEAQRVSLNVPLSPRPGLISVVPITPLLQTSPLSLGPLGPNLPAAASLAAGKPLLPQQKPKVIDSLREHGLGATKLADLKGERGSAALEANFMSAAALGDGVIAPSADDSAPRVEPAQDLRPLPARMLERVRLDDRGRADEKKVLEDSFKRMLATPTGRRYAEEFLAEGLTAHVHFEDFPNSRLLLVDGRKKFYAALAYTDWRQEGYAEIRLNRHYVDGDPDYLRESLPSILGHELLGHGLWYGRAAKEGLYPAFHYHELNETLARLVGWAIDHELDGRFEEAGVWSYLSDPARYLSSLKMRLPYYAVTFGQAELANPMQTLRLRLADAEQEVAHARHNLAVQKTWLPVLDHFSRDHGIPAQRFTLLRKELEDQEAGYQGEIVNAEAIVWEVSGLLGRLEAEPGHTSALYLSQAAAHPFFARLSAETERLGEILQRLVAAAPPAPPRPAPSRPAGQISWIELAEMYKADMAADAHRAVKHWRPDAP